MATYIVTFEVSNMTKKNTLKEGIKQLFTGVCPLTDNAFIVLSENGPEAMRDQMTPYIDVWDKIYVFRCSAPGAWKNAYSKEHSDWLKKYL